MAVPFKADLSGEVAVVTGGGGVLCGAMARALAECGAAVAVAGRHLETTGRVADEINAAGGRAAAVVCDVLDRASLAAANEEVSRRLGPATILLNGAGGNRPAATTAAEFLDPDAAGADGGPGGGPSTFYDLDPEGAAAVFNLNFLGTWLATQAFTRQMARNRRGAIVNISSMNAFRPLTKIPAYSAAKAAVGNFTQWMAVHLARAGIRVNAIAPGFFLTAQNRGLLTNGDGSPTPRAAKILAHTPMGRYGDPADLIGALLWLVSDAAAGFVTGIVVPVDGGFSAYSGV